MPNDFADIISLIEFFTLNYNLELLIENLKKISDEEIDKETKSWKVPEKIFSNAYSLNGTVKRFNLIKKSVKKQQVVIVAQSQTIFFSYVTFVLMKNNIDDANLNGLKDKSALVIFKKIFDNSKNANPSNEDMSGIARLIRNSIAHGTFAFEENGLLRLKDMGREIIVECFYLIKLCEQIERLYSIGVERHFALQIIPADR